MQTIVAFKTDGKITLVSNSNLSTDNYLISSNAKNIQVCENGIVLVADGTVKEINVLDEIAYCLDEPLNELTKDYIIDNILPVIHNVLEENGLIEFTPKGSLDIMFSLIVAYQDKLFYINNMFDILEVSDYITLGQYQGPVFVKMDYINDQKIMLERTLQVMDELKGICYHLDDYVFIVDTLDLIITKESVKDAFSNQR